ncbi:hypothetical protein ADUPG1_013776 [Aduncisulcus paluster]|uniref:EGF-like domain-containing protein n=1 Tax=Aduncisulcus paluster TaxID=2918883 RepID=A0ABQ5K452_9EUKA|nr:hypothetical protein ADUPG1_013776 [Aduncisulcus paluster]
MHPICTCISQNTSNANNDSTTPMNVYIPDDNTRRDVCNSIGYGVNLCDATMYEMARLKHSGISHSGGPISDIEGLEYLLNIGDMDISYNSIISIDSFDTSSQLNVLTLNDNSITSLGNLIDVSRLISVNASGNNNMYDVSTLYRSVGLYEWTMNTSTGSNAICRSESDDEYLQFLQSVFPGIDPTSDLGNSCPLNPTGATSCTGNDQCPSVVLNEVYNASSQQKQCAAIAKSTGSVADDSLVCYTIHDDNLRAYLLDTFKNIKAEENGMIPVSQIRSHVTGSLSIAQAQQNYGHISTLLGLEFAVGLTELDLSDYDLSNDVDKSVVKILTKTVILKDDASTTYGLQTLDVSNGTGIRRLSDIFDLTPIDDSIDNVTQPFRIQNLNISYTEISDLSPLISTALFPVDGLSTLSGDGAKVCDNDDENPDVMNYLVDYFTNISINSISLDSQNCECIESALFVDDHIVCNQKKDGVWDTDCWYGYYHDRATDQCKMACSSQMKLNSDGECVADESVTADYAASVQLCDSVMPQTYAILNVDASDVECVCDNGYVGSSCQLVCDSDVNCNGNGSCDFGYVDGGVEAIKCICVEGYDGIYCSNNSSKNNSWIWILVGAVVLIVIVPIITIVIFKSKKKGKYEPIPSLDPNNNIITSESLLI